MKHLIFLVIVISTSSILNAQQKKLDSLKIEFNKATQDTTKARLLSEIGIAAYYINSDLAKKYNDTLIEFSKNISPKHLVKGYQMKGVLSLLESDYENAETYYLKGLEVAKKVKNKKYEAGLLASLGDLNGRQQKTDVAVNYYLQSIKIHKENNLEAKSIIVYTNLASIMSSSNNILDANEYLIKALEIAEKYNSNKLHYVHKEIGSNYIILLQHDKAEFHLLKALEIANNKEDIYALGIIHQSLAVLYDGKNNDYKKALLHNEQALHFYTLQGNKKGMINSYNGIGQQSFQLGLIAKAKDNYIKGIELATSTKDTKTLIITNYHLGELYANQGNSKLANKYITAGDNLIGGDSKMQFKNHYWKIGKAFAKSKQYKTAYEQIESFTVLSDSLYKKNGIEKVAELETKYETEKKEKENLQLKADNIIQEQLTKQANNQKKMFGFGLLASLIILGVFYFFYRKNKKQKHLIENLQKELHHRVKNNLSIIDTFIEVAKEEFDDPKFKTKLTELQNRIDSINSVHSQLYQNNDVTNLEVTSYIKILVQNIQSSFPNSKIVVHKNITEDLKIHADKSFPIGLIVNEFLTNSYKYAFDSNDSNDSEIHIDIKENNQQYKLLLSDNGKGLPKDFDIKKIDSFGMRIMKLLTQQLNGTFKLTGNNGVKLNITFPKA